MSKFVLLPALTFLVGLMLGGALVWVALPDDGGGIAGQGPSDAATAPSPELDPSPADPSAAATIAQACVRAAEASIGVVDLVQDAATALSKLDAPRLQALVDEMEVLDEQIREDVRLCRQESSF